MAINFAALPTDSPNQLVAPGLYYAKVTDAVMTKPKDVTKPDYLLLTLALTDANGKSAGTLQDGMYDSDKAAIQYKLGRFVRACKIQIPGVMELKDLAKLVINKEVVVDVQHSKATEQYAAKAQVNLFEHEAYYLKEEFATALAACFPNVTGAMPDMSVITNIPDNAPDGGVEFNTPVADAPETTAPVSSDY